MDCASATVHEQLEACLHTAIEGRNDCDMGRRTSDSDGCGYDSTDAVRVRTGGHHLSV